MKMKISVIIAVFHMSMGIVVKGLNAVYFKEKIVLYFEVITGMIILNGLFGWMDFLIIYKWFYEMNPYSTAADMVARINAAPSIITIMINNLLSGGNQPFTNSSGTYEIYLFPAQKGVSEFLVVCVFICIPLMLFVKPCSMMYCPEFAGLEDIRAHNEAARTEDSQNPNGEEALLANYEANTTSQLQMRLDEYQELLDQEKEGHEAHSINEVFIHQLIETIEFVLGCVSNTASYLRLWALSLAHSQLALVFLQEILQVPWNHLSLNVGAQTVGSFLIWFPFMSATWGVLMMMDTLECFLHTLRLHWVEFQNKFFKGTGYLYRPFSFDAVFYKETARPVSY